MPQRSCNFKRNPGEGIGNFLVRETLGYEEFVEALLRLHEESSGVGQSRKDFGLPKNMDSGWDEWGESWSDWDYQPVTEETPPSEGEQAPEAPGDVSGLSGTAAPGSAPSQEPCPDAQAGSPPAQRVTDTTGTPGTITELSMADSFIFCGRTSPPR